MNRDRAAALPSPLEGIRVLEVANWLAAPAAAALLGDMGAEVVKVEPLEGDAWRRAVPELDWQPGQSVWNPGFHLDNRGKRSVAINLGRPEARDLLLTLAEKADVLITNLTPGRARRYGVTYPAARRRNSRLIYLQLTGWGVCGPDRDRPGFDDVAFWASSGIMAGLGEPGQAPVQNRASIGDHTTALALLSGVLAALLQRERTGVGQYLQCSLLATGLWAFGDEIQGLLETGKTPPRHTREAPSVATHNTYRLRDGSWVMLAGSPDRFWSRLCRALELPQQWRDPKLADVELHAARAGEIRAMLDRVFATRTVRQLKRRFREEGLIWAPVTPPQEAVRNPQVELNDVLAAVPGADYRTLNMPVRFGGSRVEPRGPAPAAGQHTDEVMREIGLDPAQIAALRSAGVIA